MYGQIRLLYIIGLSILIQLILQLLKGLLFGFSISLESHSCWQYRRIKSFLGLIQRLLVHEIEKGHTMLIGCYLKVGLLNQIYNYDETIKTWWVWCKYIRKTRAGLYSTVFFVRFRIINVLRTLLIIILNDFWKRPVLCLFK